VEDAEPSTIDADENAWWAAREELVTAYEPAPRPTAVSEGESHKSGFEEYFSTESLFTYGATSSGTDTDDGSLSALPLDPYRVLGVADGSTWEEITTAHRRLAKLHHPDRLLHATAADRELSERRMRELNIAYSELRRRRGR
jgi:DnaJ-class molecular chaperone